MTEREAFVRAVCAEPGDDTRRLAFADWLEEHGEADRAAFVRRAILDPLYRECESVADTCNQGEPSGSCGAWGPTVTDITGMLAHNGTERNREARRWYRRGFVWRVGLPVLAFLEHARELFAHHPITDVVLYDRHPNAYHRDRTGDRRVWRWDACDAADLSPDTPLPGFVPRELWAGSELRVRRGGQARTFTSEAAARAALSRRCVSYGRGLVGLPQLDPAPAA